MSRSAVASDPRDDVRSYNIIPIHNLLSDHPSLRFPEVRAAVNAFLASGSLRKPPSPPNGCPPPTTTTS
ncbi:hypothetical protein MLD38_020001 [Melastoma candidum]|uniref:Uncharacterized protein n=1 Tax=Melastoma candidum TaxID=119954 RepID=A0ACB9QJI5_9MYRT|nr:hypothetical protein MLD38_020001 [Melastoma candidum]